MTGSLTGSIEETIREKARELLESGSIDDVIGYERATDGIGARPAFVYRFEDVGRLIFDETCTHNLVKYLLDRKGRRTAIVVKPCDARSLNVLLSEHQVQRDRLFVIGVVCPGIRERDTYGGMPAARQARCEECEERVPVVYDFLAGGDSCRTPDSSGGRGEADREAAAGPTDRSCYRQEIMARLEAMSAREKAAFWAEQFSRCLRCYACRQVCPGCYCAECFVEQLDPEWVGIRIAPPENWLFHTIRALHLAGRCVGCDECERVCPVHIPLSLLNHKVDEEVVEMFNHRTGARPDVAAPLFTFRPDDRLPVG